jgi:hypothetical protein
MVAGTQDNTTTTKAFKRPSTVYWAGRDKLQLFAKQLGFQQTSLVQGC